MAEMKEEYGQPMERTIRPIAHICNDFPTKFGIPRQSGLVPSLRAQVVFEPEFRSPEALRGLEEFSHIWLLWEFSQAVRPDWSPTVRPPRLGGNERKGVFATRSPFRPNHIGLSCVQLERIEWGNAQGAVLHILGADLMDGTPIYDIKPYVPYADSYPDARGSFADQHREDRLRVCIPDKWKSVIPAEHLDALEGVLEQDPRPAYQEDAKRIYGFRFAEWEIKFTVAKGVLTVCEVEEAERGSR